MHEWEHLYTHLFALHGGYPLCTAHRTVYTTVYNMHCTVYTEYCIVATVQFTIHILTTNK